MRDKKRNYPIKKIKKKGGGKNLIHVCGGKLATSFHFATKKMFFKISSHSHVFAIFSSVGFHRPVFSWNPNTIAPTLINFFLFLMNFPRGIKELETGVL